MSIPTIEEIQGAVAAHLGSPVLSVRRQLRWRPTWFVDAEIDGAVVPLVVRGNRTDTEVLPLRHELAFHSLLQDNGLPVPKIYGWLDGVKGVLMEKVPGIPDLIRTPIDERDQVVDEYLQVLARLHALPIEPFVAAGITRASSPEESAMVVHNINESIYTRTKTRPDPFMEFCTGWMHRHEPRSQGRETAIVWDSGQFHHEGGHLVSILDLEFGHIGDPMADLAVWRMRDTLIPFGDFHKLYARYEELSGRPVDIEAVKLHYFAATLSNQLMFGNAVLDPPLDTDLMNNMQWNSETNIMATEALAEFMDIELPTVETPEPISKRTDSTYEHVIAKLRNISGTDEFVQHELRLMFRAARHLFRSSQIGDELERENILDLKELLGYAPDNWAEADAALERFVIADKNTGEYDAQLVPLFHRRNLRNHMSLGPLGSSMTKHYTPQPF